MVRMICGSAIIVMIVLTAGLAASAREMSLLGECSMRRMRTAPCAEHKCNCKSTSPNAAVCYQGTGGWPKCEAHSAETPPCLCDNVESDGCRKESGINRCKLLAGSGGYRMCHS